MVAASERVNLNREEIVPLTGKRVSVANLIGLTVFASLLIVILLTSIPYGTVEPWSEAIFECVIFGLAGLSIVEMAITGHINWRSYTIILPIICLTTFAFVQTLQFGTEAAPLTGNSMWNAISADPFQTRRWILKMLALVLVGAMLIRYTTNEQRLRALAGMILLVAIVSALFGLMRQTTQRENGFLFLSYLPKASGYAQFINKNHFAYLAEMALGIALGGIFARGIKRELKLVYLALSVPLWAALVLCNSRGGVFSMLGQILFLAIIWMMIGRGGSSTNRESSQLERIKRSWPFRIVLLCGLLLFIFVGTIWMGGEPLATRLERVKDEIGQTETSPQGAGRQDIWRSTWALIKDHPLVGVGFGGYWAAIPQYHKASGEATPQEAHNDYLELLASGGIVGLILSLWFLALFIKKTRKVWLASNGYRRAVALGALTGIFGIALHSLVDFGLHITINALIFTTLIVIATADIRMSENRLN